MRLLQTFSRALLVLGLAAPAAAPQTTAIRFARLVDGMGHTLTDAVVVIQGDRITSVGSGARAIPAGAEVIDLRPLTGIPGLIDCHTPMTYYWDQRPGTQPWTQPGRRRGGTGDEAFQAAGGKAAVDAAHGAGKRIAIHSYGAQGGRDAMRAGAESVEHAVDLDDSTLTEMAARGTYYVPTIDHNRYYAENREQFGYTLEQAAALDAYRARNIEPARRAFKAHVRLAMGSDAVFTMFGQNTRELAWFTQIGMTPAEALATATSNAAALLGMGKSLGALSPGYYADVVAVAGDPQKEIGRAH